MITYYWVLVVGGIIKKISYGRQDISQKDIDSVTDALQQDLLTVGPLVDLFERKLSEFTGADDTVVVSSGTAALHCAYAAIGVRDTEVITTPLTFISTASTAVLQGAKIVFCDIENDSGNIDPEIAADLVTKKTSVITTVDYAGNPCDGSKFTKIRKINDRITLLSDSSHSLGSKINGEGAGSFADLTVYSFYPTKNITSGEGGAISSNNVDLINKVRRFKMHGLVRDNLYQRNPNEGPWHQEVHEFGLNYRLSDIHCALGISQLAQIEMFKKKRNQIFNYYITHLADIADLILPIAAPNSSPMWHLFPIRVPRQHRKKLFDHLRAQNIIVQVNYIPVYHHPVFEDLGYKKGLCPVAEDYYEREISLPIHTKLLPSDLERICDLIRSYFGY